MRILTGSRWSFTPRLNSSLFFSTTVGDPKPSEIFRLVSVKEIDQALELCSDFAKAVNLSSRDFLSKQCSERSYLIYRLSVDSRSEALQRAQDGSGFPDGVTASKLLDDDLWDDDLKEQYQRAVNCLNLSGTALELASPNRARDYQIIGKSVVHKLLLGRTACILQTFMSRILRGTSKPYEWAIANHRKAASLFDTELSPGGPLGPLESPESTAHDVEVFKSWSDRRRRSANEHVRLIVHLISDVSRHVLSREDAKAFLNAADVILSDEIEDDKERRYAKGVLAATLKAI